MSDTNYIAITGHSRGIGKAVANKFSQEGYTVIGFSRSNGYDISNAELNQKCINEIVNSPADTVILNAYYEFAQVTQLYSIANAWGQDPSKTIVVIGSRGADDSKNFIHQYSIHKKALDNVCYQLNQSCTCRIINIRPGYTDTDLIRDRFLDKPKMLPATVADIVWWTVNQPLSLVVQNLTVVPRLVSNS